MPVSDFTPTVAAVGSVLRARTKTQGGAEAGTFNPAAAWEDGSGDGTRPTQEQVTELISDAMVDIVGAFGSDVPDAPGDDPDAYRTAVARLAAVGVALEVELGYFPEQVATGRSPYAQLKELYDGRFKRLVGLISEAKGGDASDDSPANVGSGLPSWGGFPETGIGMEHPW